jgi:hypothetical protein
MAGIRRGLDNKILRAGGGITRGEDCCCGFATCVEVIEWLDGRSVQWRLISATYTLDSCCSSIGDTRTLSAQAPTTSPPVQGWVWDATVAACSADYLVRGSISCQDASEGYVGVGGFILKVSGAGAAIQQNWGSGSANLSYFPIADFVVGAIFIVPFNVTVGSGCGTANSPDLEVTIL